MANSIDRQEFGIRVYRGSERVGEICYEIGIRDMEGEVSFTTEDLELRKALKKALGKQRRWLWKDMTRRLIDHLSLTTGGRFVLRFGTTPSDEGRGSSEHGLRRAIDRAVNE
jgi:hypothetical protein